MTTAIRGTTITGATGSTTATEARWPSRLILVASTTVIALGLIAAAVPRLVAGLILAPYDATVRALGSEERPPVAAVDRALDSRRSALAWHESGRIWAERGALALARADLSGSAVARAAYLGEAVQALRRAVTLAPAQAVAWLQLSAALLARDGPGPGAARALAQAVRVAPNDPPFLAARLDLALVLWPHFDQADRVEARIIVEQAVTFDMGLAVAAVRRRHALAAAREALAQTPALLTLFSLAYLGR